MADNKAQRDIVADIETTSGTVGEEALNPDSIPSGVFEYEDPNKNAAPEINVRSPWDFGAEGGNKLNFIGNTELTTPVEGDIIPIHDASTSLYKKITLANLIHGAVELSSLAASEDELLIYDVSASAFKRISKSNLVQFPTLHVQDQKAATTAGGGFTSGAWQTRTLNTELTNTITGASLASNQITLPAGTYEIEARAPACNVNHHKTALYNTTTSTYIMYGSNAFNAPGGYAETDSIVRGRFTLAAESVLELRHQCTTTRGTDGFGLASSFSVIEIYADVLIRKVA